MKLNPISHEKFSGLLKLLEPFGEDGNKHGEFLLSFPQRLGDTASKSRSALIIVLYAKIVNYSLEELGSIPKPWNSVHL